MGGEEAGIRQDLVFGDKSGDQKSLEGAVTTFFFLFVLFSPL